MMRRFIVGCLMISIISYPVAAQLTSPMMIEAPGPSGPLLGTAIGTSKTDAPVVLIVPGSGPTDRDGNNPLGVRASSYRLIAEGLAARGIRSVRVDKRGMFGSKQAVPDANAVTIQDYAADIQTWVSTIRKTMGSPCVWVLGHSEGGLSALVAAQQAGDICGLLLMATPGRRLGEVLREQIRMNPANAPILEQAEFIITQLEAGRRVEANDVHPALRPLFQPEVQGFLISMLALDPTKLIASYRGPMLILQGLLDMQVRRVDAERLHQARPDASLVLLADANHVLKGVASNDRAANIAADRDPDKPLASGVIEALAAFILASRGPR
jgi:uncharacterized protein